MRYNGGQGPWPPIPAPGCARPSGPVRAPQEEV